MNNERVSFGISQKLINKLLNEERFPHLSKKEEVEGIFDEMHEQGQGYAADKLRILGRKLLGNNNAVYEIALTETFDLIPYRYQNDLLNPGYVDSVISILKHSVESNEHMFKFNLSWYENGLQDKDVDRWQGVKTQQLGPENATIYKFGSEAMSLMFGFREFTKNLTK
jgi:hypothetical protein